MDAISLPEITPKIIPPKTNTQELPPWNGYGSHADSAGNCNTIEPKAPRCDFFKFLHKDRYNFIQMDFEYSNILFCRLIFLTFPISDWVPILTYCGSKLE